MSAHDEVIAMLDRWTQEYIEHARRNPTPSHRKELAAVVFAFAVAACDMAGLDPAEGLRRFRAEAHGRGGAS